MSIRRKNFWIAGLIAVVAIAVIAICFRGRSELLRPDAEGTKKAVLTRIPIGTSIKQAQAIMEEEGFKCTATHSGFTEDRPEGGAQLSHPPANILYCDSGERITLELLITKRWQIIFVDDNGHVAHVAVGVGLTGL